MERYSQQKDDQGQSTCSRNTVSAKSGRQLVNLSRENSRDSMMEYESERQTGARSQWTLQAMSQSTFDHKINGKPLERCLGVG